MHRPRIGIPLSLDNQGRWREGRHYHYIDRRYADAVDRAGGRPLQLPIQSDASALAAELDGLLIPGGDDFPSERALPEDVQLELVPEEQLSFDEALVHAARTRGLPILGICYGMQLLVRSSGGSLEPHLPSQRPPPGEHRLPSTDRHSITVEPGSLLASILEVGVTQVNSLHHQAVRDTGPEYRIAARAGDGVIEAVEAKRAAARRPGTPPWEIGVQWHPEKMADGGSHRLFAAFVEACATHARSARGAGR